MQGEVVESTETLWLERSHFPESGAARPQPRSSFIINDDDDGDNEDDDDDADVDVMPMPMPMTTI